MLHGNYFGARQARGAEGSLLLYNNLSLRGTSVGEECVTRAEPAGPAAPAGLTGASCLCWLPAKACDAPSLLRPWRRT